jgi:hypothetical protein
VIRANPPGRIHRLSVFRHIGVLPWVLQVIRPIFGNPLIPGITCFVFIGQQDDQPNRFRRQLSWDANLQSVLVIDIARQLDRIHRSMIHQTPVTRRWQS